MQNDPEAIEDKQAVPVVAATPSVTTVPVVVASTPAAAAAAGAASAAIVAAESLDFGSLSLITAFFAIIVMIQSAVICGNAAPAVACDGIRGYQVAVGAVSGFFGLIAFFMNLKAPVAANVALGFGMFQFLWWVAGVIVLTFFGDYQNTAYANGYFGAWGAFIFATFTMMAVSDVFKANVSGFAHSSRKALLFLFFSSGIVMGASIGPCSPQTRCTGYSAFAVALGVISMCFSLVLIVASAKIAVAHMRNIAMFLILWWVIGCGIVTFGGPFTSTGNGYFASYVALISAVGVLQSVNSKA